MQQSCTLQSCEVYTAAAGSQLRLLVDGPGVAGGEPVAGVCDELVGRRGASAAELVQVGLNLLNVEEERNETKRNISTWADGREMKDRQKEQMGKKGNLLLLQLVEDGSKDLPGGLELVVAHKQVVIALDDVEDQTLVG